MKGTLAAVVAALALPGLAGDQRPATLPGVSVAVRQIEVAVRAPDGRPVAGLRPKDFEVLEDGRPQAITHFSVMAPVGVTPPAPVGEAEGTPALVPAGAAQDPPLLAFVVDDLTLSAEGVPRVRRALKSFVMERMAPHEAAVILTTGGRSPLPRPTSDRERLMAAVSQVSWNPASRRFRTLPSVELGFLAQMRGQPGLPADDLEAAAPRGGAAALASIFARLAALGGRKSVVLLSDGLEGGAAFLADLARRASAVVYAVDARGLQSLGLAPDDDVTAAGIAAQPAMVLAELGGRAAEFEASQAGLRALAARTGGLFLPNVDRLGRVLEDERGGYLIGYALGDAAPGGHPPRIVVKTRRGHARVRWILSPSR